VSAVKRAGNALLQSAIAQLMVGVSLAAIVGLMSAHFAFGPWKGRVDTLLEQVHENSVEIKGLIKTIEAIRTETSADRAATLSLIGKLTEDRFKSSDWMREKEVLDMKFQALHKRFDELEKKMNGH